MRLKLTNFGIWTDKTFEFPENGLTLISGQSGKGKTTILRAINYALTGAGTKLPSIGEKRCSVVFEYNGMTVSRTNTPYRLIVKTNKGDFEGDEAQSVIYQNIGKNFDIAGYIQQKGENSFLSMTPSDKLKFLEEIAFVNVPIDEIKDKVKELVRNSELNLTAIQGELKYLTDNAIKEPLKVEFDKTQLDDVRQLIKTLTKQKEDFIKQQERLKWLSQTILNTRMDDIPKEILPNGEEEMLNEWIKYDEYKQEMKTIADIELRRSKNQKDIDDLLASLLLVGDVGNIEEQRAEMLDLSESLTIFKRQQFKNSFNLERYNTLIELIPSCEENLRVLIQSKEMRKCPCCQVSLRILKDSLELNTSCKEVYSLEKEKELKTQLVAFKNELTTLEIIKRQLSTFADVEETEEIELDPVEIEEAISDLKKSISEGEKVLKKRQEISIKLETHQKFNLQQSPPSPQEVIAPLQSKKELEQSISNRKAILRDITRITKENDEKKNRILSLQEEISSCNVIEDPSTSLHSSIDEQSHLVVMENKHIQYTKDMLVYRTFTDNQKRIKKTLKEAEAQFTRNKKFLTMLATAEMLALTELIDEINTHLEMYLSVFFPDNPLTVELCLFKSNEKTKTVKNQINIQVGYRGVSTDLSMLSGGEKDRVNLAFTLALAEIFQIPLLMLDETLSSLDRDTTENILEHIQKDSRGILVVAHQVSTGLFDHVFEM